MKTLRWQMLLLVQASLSFGTPYYNPMDFAGLDGIVSTSEFQTAIDTASHNRGKLMVPIGTYYVNSTLTVTNEAKYGAFIEGENPEGTKIVSSVADSNPLFRFKGHSGTLSNVGISNMTCSSTVANSGVRIEVDGQDFVMAQNLRLKYFKFGIWLHNKSTGAFSELNQVRGAQYSNAAKPSAWRLAREPA